MTPVSTGWARRAAAAVGVISLAVVAWAALPARPASGDAEAEDRPAKGKYADMVDQDRGRARYVRQEWGDTAEGARYGGRFDDIVKEDLVLAKTDFDAEAALFDRAADAWEAGDQPKAQQLRAEADA